MSNHSHYPGITCTGPLNKSQCDELWRRYQHGHEGVPCEKRVLPGNKIATCITGMTPEQLEARLSQAQ